MNSKLTEFWQKEFQLYLKQHFPSDDGSHDLTHFDRVFNLCKKIAASENEKADELVLLAASYFHDFVNLPKNHPERHLASRHSAIKAEEILRQKNYPADLSKVSHAIIAHSFSAAIPTQTIEAKILQDADRLEALGAIGIARCFYISGKMSSSLFDGQDPTALHRPLDDKKYALDHFHTKLYKLPETFQTQTGKLLAQSRVDFIKIFEKQMLFELEK